MEKMNFKCILLVNLLFTSCALKVSPLSMKTHYYLPKKKKKTREKELEFCNLFFFFNGTYERDVMVYISV